MKLEECVNYLLGAAQNNVFKHMSSKLSPFGLTPAQYGVLNCLWNQEADTPKQLCERLRIEASSISSILDRMQANDLIVRNIDLNDRRAIRIDVTEKGMALREMITKIVDEVNQDFLSFLEPEQKAFFISTLLTIADTKPQ